MSAHICNCFISGPATNIPQESELDIDDFINGDGNDSLAAIDDELFNVYDEHDRGRTMSRVIEEAYEQDGEDVEILFADGSLNSAHLSYVHDDDDPRPMGDIVDDDDEKNGHTKPRREDT